MKKHLFTLGAAVAMTAAMSMQAFAFGWQQNETGRWYGTNADNTTWHSNGWQWIDSNSDQIAECYYFDANGYLLTNTVTPDGYLVGGDGAWIVDGIVQTQTVAATLGWQPDGYGWKYYTGSKYITSSWRNIKGSSYYFDESGYMLTGFQEIDGGEYYFDSSGALKKENFYLDGVYYIVDSDGTIQDEIDDSDWDVYTDSDYDDYDDYEDPESYYDHYYNDEEDEEASGTDVSEAEAREKILALKSSYPEGKKWDNSNKHVSGYRTGYGCAGFAFLVQDKVFGKGAALTQYTDFDPDNIHIGDHFRIYNGYGGEHSVIILDVLDDGVELVEGNYNSSIHWGRVLDFDELEDVFIYQETRY